MIDNSALSSDLLNRASVPPISPNFCITQDLVTRFLDEQDLNPLSNSTYRRSLRQFCKWHEVQVSKPFTKQTILEFKRWMAGRGLSAFTQSNYLSPIRRFFEWTESRLLYPNIAKNVRNARHTPGFRRDPLSRSQISALLGFESSSLKDKRDKALLNVLIRTGPRSIELCRADVGDVRQYCDETVLWLQGKGRASKDAFVVLMPGVLTPLISYLASRPTLKPNDPLFTSVSNSNSGQRLSTRSIRRIVKMRLNGMGIIGPRFTTHGLRDTAITSSLLAGASLQEAAALARHANIQTTLRYAQNMNRIQDAAEKRLEEYLA